MCFFYLQYLVSPIEQEFFIDFFYFAMIFMTKYAYFTAPLSTDDRRIKRTQIHSLKTKLVLNGHLLQVTSRKCL